MDGKVARAPARPSISAYLMGGFSFCQFNTHVVCQLCRSLKDKRYWVTRARRHGVNYAYSMGGVQDATIERMSRERLVAVARGDAPADRLIRGARVVNVYSGEILNANVALADGRIAYV